MKKKKTAKIQPRKMLKASHHYSIAIEMLGDIFSILDRANLTNAQRLITTNRMLQLVTRRKTEYTRIEFK